MSQEYCWGLGLEHEFLVTRAHEGQALIPEVILNSEKLIEKFMRDEESRSSRSTGASFVHSYRDTMRRSERSSDFFYVTIAGTKNGPEALAKATAAPGSNKKGKKSSTRKKKTNSNDKESDDFSSSESEDKAMIDKMFSVHPFLKLFVENVDILGLPDILPVPHDADDKDLMRFQEVSDRWTSQVLPYLFSNDTQSDGRKFTKEKNTYQALTNSLLFYPITAEYVVQESIDFAAEIAKLIQKHFDKNPSLVESLKAKCRKFLMEYLRGLSDNHKSVRVGDAMVVYAFPAFTPYFSLGLPHTPKVSTFSARADFSTVPVKELIKQVIDTYKHATVQIGKAILREHADQRAVGESRTHSDRSDGEDPTPQFSPVTLDFPFIEAKNVSYENQSIAGVVKQVMDVEQKVLTVANSSSSKEDSPSSNSSTPESSLRSLPAYIYPYSGLALPHTPLVRPGLNTSMEEHSSMFYSFMLDDEILKEEIRPQYAGSHHVWITLPYNNELFLRSVTERERLSRCHALLAHKLQWIEPLLMGIMSGDPRAPGNGLMFPRSSMRSVMNYLSGYGTSDASSLLHLDLERASPAVRASMLKNLVSVYYSSPEAAMRSILPSVKNSTQRQLQQKEETMDGLSPISFLEDDVSNTNLWVKIRGVWSTLRTCANTPRMVWSGPQSAAHRLSFQDRTLSDYDERNPYQRDLHSLGAGYTINAKNDIRVENCRNVLSFPLMKGWIPVWIQESQISKGGGVFGILGKKNKTLDLALYFINPETSQITQDAPIDEIALAKLKPSGFEFRVMDNCPVEDMIQVLRLVALLGACAEDEDTQTYSDPSGTARLWDKLQKTRAIDSDSWNKSIVKVSTYGSFAKLSSSYIKDLRTKAGLPALSKHVSKNAAAYDILIELCNELHQKYSMHPTSQKLQMNGFFDETRKHRLFDAQVPPVPVNRNAEHWIKSFHEKLGDTMSNKIDFKPNNKNKIGPWSHDIENIKRLILMRSNQSVSS